MNVYNNYHCSRPFKLVFSVVIVSCDLKVHDAIYAHAQCAGDDALLLLIIIDILCIKDYEYQITSN